MGSIAGIVAGLAVLGGAVAIARLTGGRLDKVKNAFKGEGDVSNDTPDILDYEQDPDTGVFKPKDD